MFVHKAGTMLGGGGGVSVGGRVGVVRSQMAGGHSWALTLTTNFSLFMQAKTFTDRKPRTLEHYTF